ncbi:MAG: hypothetical protein AB1512_18895 [Thermodesulfobacteriota bacterium]
MKPPYDEDTVEGQIWRSPYITATPFKASPHVCDIIVLSGIAEYGYAENPNTHRMVQGVKLIKSGERNDLQNSSVDAVKGIGRNGLPSNAQVLLIYLNNNPQKSFCDDCLSDRLAIRPRQQVNQICDKRLKPRGKILRRRSTCALCSKIKLVNSASLISCPVSEKPILPEVPGSWEPSAANDIQRVVTGYYSKIQQDPHHRYRSWEHCYLFFQQHRPFHTSEKRNMASLHLAFYLASWGMYRGSTFLLWKDYRVLDTVVDALTDSAYEPLYHLDLNAFPEASDTASLVFQLKGDIVERFGKSIHSVDGQAKETKVTDTLITKILLGTMACAPAYDKFFREGLKKTGFKHRRFTKAGYMELLSFCRINSSAFSELRLPILNADLVYPPMKLMDMYLWSVGSGTR